MKGNSQNRIGIGRTAGLAFAAAALVVTGGTVNAQLRGDCVSVAVPAGMKFPDGSARPAGQLRICLADKLSPVAGLHTAYVDGRAVGLFASRMASSEGHISADDAEALVQFRPTRDGLLALSAYAVPQRRHGKTKLTVFRLSDAGANASAKVVGTGATLDVATDGRGASIILIARSRP